jgi:hypothetical protein
MTSILASSRNLDQEERNIKTDNINHPEHYTSMGIECIQVTEMFNFCKGNAIKYIWRAGKKGDEIEDLNKAIWYINREIENIKKARLAEHKYRGHCEDCA